MAYELLDVSYGITVGETKAKSLEDVLKIVTTPQKQYANDYTDGSTIIINSDRLILNSKKDSVLLCGKDGVTITSPKKIHIDTDDDVHIYGSEIYIGLPNKGDPWEQVPKPTNKAKDTLNTAYEPMVLGLKLANLLQDLIVLLKNTVVVGNSGQSFMSTQMMYNLACLQARVPEIMSTVAFIDGVSHDKVDPEPPLPEGVVLGPDGLATQSTTPVAGGTPGSTVSSTQATNTGPSQTNTSGTPATDPAAGTTTGGTATSVANTGTATDPTAPTQNLDGPAPTTAAGWVPDQIIATGTQIAIGPLGTATVPWTVSKAQVVDVYKGLYNDNIGQPVYWTDTDVDNVVNWAKTNAQVEADKKVALQGNGS